MAAITWKNIESDGAFRTAGALFQSANQGINSGFDAFNKVLAQRQQTEEANHTNQGRLNTLEYQKMLAGKSPEEIQAMQQDGTLQGLQQRLGPNIDDRVASGDMLRQSLTQAMTDSNAARTYDKGILEDRINPVIENINLLNLQGKTAEANALRDQHSSDLAAIGQLDDVEQNRLKFTDDAFNRERSKISANQADWNFGQSKDDASRAAAERASEANVARIQMEADALGVGDRDKIEFLRNAISDPNSGVLPTAYTTGINNFRGVLDARSAPTAGETQKINQDTRTLQAEAAGIENTLNSRLATADASIEALPDALRMDQKDYGVADLMDKFRSYNLNDSRGFWEHLFLRPDRTASDLDRALTTATSMLKEAGLEGQILPGKLLDMTARSIVEGSGPDAEPGELKMEKLINSLPYVTARLLKQKGDYTAARDDKTDTKGKLNQLPVSTANNLSAIERQFIDVMNEVRTPTRREVLR